MTEVSDRNRLLFLLNTLQIGGSERKVIRIANALANLGWCAKIAYLNDPHTLLNKIDKRVDVINLKRRGKLSVPAMLRLRKYIDSENIGTVVSVNLYPSLYMTGAMLFYNNQRVKTIITVNTTNHRGAKERAQMLIYSRILRQVDHIVFGCRLQQENWCDTYAVPRSRSSVVYNGVDTDSFGPLICAKDAKQLRYSLGFEPSDVVVGTVGQLRPEKAHHLLLEAIARLRACTPNLRALIVGDGPMHSVLERRIRELGISKEVRLIGEVDDIRPALGVMDIFVLCSVAVETFSNAALEAMSSGKPVILSDIGGAREMVDHGRNGFVYSPANIGELEDLLSGLLSNPASRVALGAAARSTAISSFSFNRMICDYENILGVKSNTEQ